MSEIAEAPAEVVEAAEDQLAGAAPAPPRRTPLSALAPRASSPWAGRLAFLAFAGVLFALPGMLGGPTDVRTWAEWLCYAMVAVGLDVALSLIHI